MKEEWTITIKNPLFTFIRNRRWKKYARKWNADRERILNYIETSTYKGYFESPAFMWTQMVEQELTMWVQINKLVTSDEHKWMCERRGFDLDMCKYTEEMLKHIGLWIDHDPVDKHRHEKSEYIALAEPAEAMLPYLLEE